MSWQSDESFFLYLFWVFFMVYSFFLLLSSFSSLFPYTLLLINSIFFFPTIFRFLTLSWRGPISYRNQSIDLLCKSMDWFLYDIDLRHERVKRLTLESSVIFQLVLLFCHFLMDAVNAGSVNKLKYLACYVPHTSRITT